MIGFFPKSWIYGSSTIVGGAAGKFLDSYKDNADAYIPRRKRNLNPTRRGSPESFSSEYIPSSKTSSQKEISAKPTSISFPKISEAPRIRRETKVNKVPPIERSLKSDLLIIFPKKEALIEKASLGLPKIIFPAKEAKPPVKIQITKEILIPIPITKPSLVAPVLKVPARQELPFVNEEEDILMALLLIE